MRLPTLALALSLAACGHHGAATDAAPPADGAIADGAIVDGAPAIDAAPLVGCTAQGLPGACLDATQCYGSRTSTAGLCPGPASVQCCTPRFADGVTCDPNAIPQPNAGLTEEPGDARCPAGMALVATACVDRFEAALVEVLAAGTTQPWSPYFDPHGHTVRALSLRGAVPQAYISGLDADAACVAAGKRLCTDAEWLRACQGPSGTTYPYGATRQPGVCNDARAVHPAIELYGTAASWIFSHLDSPCLDQEASGLALTGSHAGCVTAEGLFDMMGNLHEWTADPAGTFRGGFYVDTVLNGNGCLYATTAHTTTYWDYSTGFRCCATPAP
jgi:hypothetical protein